jgi:hypothetical protein
MSETTESTARIEPSADDPSVVRRRDGVGAYGLYVAYVVYSTKTNKLLREDRFFLYDRMLVRYSRKTGEKRAAWRARQYPDHVRAKKELVEQIELRSTYEGFVALEIVHMPLLIELTEADIEAVAQGEAPVARHEGARISEKVTGKIDDEIWKPLSTFTGSGGSGVTASGGSGL